MVGDSYRRALAGHYDVRVVAPEPPEALPRWVRHGMGLVAQAALREPLAFELPRIERAAREHRPDVVLVIPIDAIPPRTIDAIRRASPGARVIGVFSDHLANFGRGYFFTAAYDALFFKDRYIVDKLRGKAGLAHAWYLPQACDPELHRPVPLEPGDEQRFGCDLTLAGNLHYYRAAALAPILERGWTVKLWGAHPGGWFKHPIEGWFQHQPVFGLEKCRAMRAARIVLNQNHYAEIAGTNKRTFEVAAMGAFQLTDTPALADVFDPEREVAFYDGRSEMLDQIAHYLARPEERAAMAERAQRRAHAEHSYAHRWAAKMQVLDLPLPAGFPVDLASLRVRAH